MSWISSVLAVADEVDGVAVVWWVELGRANPGMSRLCGAWAFEGDDVKEAVPDLVAGHSVVATSSGRSLLAHLGVQVERPVNVQETLKRVIGTRDELQLEYENAATTRKNGRALVPPAWPPLPESVDLDAEWAAAGDGHCSLALGVARWFTRLCDAWDVIEQQRLGRPYLRKCGGDVARELPVAMMAAIEGE